MSSIRIFADLRAKYVSWDALKTFLTGEDGGRLLIVGEGPKVIIRYDKKASNFQIPYVHAFRSVIWDTVANIPVSIAPFKASEGEPFGANVIQDFVEGTMIHAYRTNQDSEVQLSTRTKLGAKTRFYSRRNFDELVRETPQWPSLQTILPVGSEQYVYTFANIVLQHPEHRIVANIKEPRLYITSIGSVKSDGSVEIQENPELWSPNAAALAPDTIVAPSMNITEGSSAALLTQQMAIRGWTWQGLVFKNTSSLQRWRLRSPIYTPVRDLRGSEADSYTRFLRLRHNNQLHHYIAYFPEEEKEFYELEGKLREQTREIFRLYNAVHRAPKPDRKSLKDVAWPFNKYVYTLHSLYMSQLKPIGQPLSIENVIQYVNALPVFKQRALLVTPVGGNVKDSNVDLEMEEE
jgi:hypothetical protein